MKQINEDVELQEIYNNRHNLDLRRRYADKLSKQGRKTEDRFWRDTVVYYQLRQATKQLENQLSREYEKITGYWSINIDYTGLPSPEPAEINRDSRIQNIVIKSLNRKP